MGIRIHKVMGYGLTDLEANDRAITDARISPDALIGGEMPDAHEYLAWLEAEDDDASRNLDRWMIEDSLQKGERPDLYNAVTHDGEFGLPNVIVFTPPAMSNWQRYDDSIDYVEETYPDSERDPQQAHARQFPHGFYPFSGLYMDIRTGERVGDEIMYWVRGRSAVREGRTPSESLDAMARAAGFANDREAAAYVAPLVPDEIRWLVDFLNIFNDPDSWRDLRPTLYTYWS